MISAYRKNVLFLFGFCVVSLAAGALYQSWGARKELRRYPPPGQVFDGLHILQKGTGAPAVVLESGIAGSSVSWLYVEEQVSAFARVVSYDRAGLGWSQPGTGPRTLEQITLELRTLLQKAGIPAPYILVGHSFGGLMVRYFAAAYPAEVAGIVLVDAVSMGDWHPLSESQRSRLRLGVLLSRRGAWLARFGVVRLALASLVAGSRKWPRLFARASAGKGATVIANLISEVQKLPPKVWPIIRMHWCLPKCFQAMASYLEMLPANAATAADSQIPSHIPVIALCSDYHGAKEECPERIYRPITGCGHWIQLDRPDLVTEAIRDVLEMANSCSLLAVSKSASSPCTLEGKMGV